MNNCKLLASSSKKQQIKRNLKLAGEVSGSHIDENEEQLWDIAPL
jgi:hypothetical protein